MSPGLPVTVAQVRPRRRRRVGQPTVYGQSVTFTATVSVNAPATARPLARSRSWTARRSWAPPPLNGADGGDRATFDDLGMPAVGALHHRRLRRRHQRPGQHLEHAQPDGRPDPDVDLGRRRRRFAGLRADRDLHGDGHRPGGARPRPPATARSASTTARRCSAPRRSRAARRRPTWRPRHCRPARTTITASYSGDSSFAASHSGVEPASVQSVVPAPGSPCGVAVDGRATSSSPTTTTTRSWR